MSSMCRQPERQFKANYCTVMTLRDVYFSGGAEGKLYFISGDEGKLCSKSNCKQAKGKCVYVAKKQFAFFHPPSSCVSFLNPASSTVQEIGQ